MSAASFADELLEELEEGEEMIERQEGRSSIADDEDGEKGREEMENDLAGLDGDDGHDNDDDEDSAMTSHTVSATTDVPSSSAGREFVFVPSNEHAVRPSDEMQAEDVDAMDLRPEAVQRIGEICLLFGSDRMRSVVAKIDQYSDYSSSSSSTKPDIDGVLEDSPEYQLIVEANNLAVDVDNEIMIAHKFIRQHYQSRFPELESLISNPWEFVEAVRAIGNQDNLANVRLEGILPHGTVVVISMQASTTKGRKLSAEAWQRVDEGCKLIFALDEVRAKILRYVESRMTMIAPNLSKVVGSRVATKLLGISGGLTALTKIPACNVMLLGASDKSLPGMSTAFSSRHRGFVVQAPLVESTPEEYQKQAIRMVSAKAALAARVDAGGSDRQGTYGAKLAQELAKKLEKLQEPPPAKMIKALPVPKEGGKQDRRGGRKARKMKERMGMSDLRQMQNRVRFGEAEEEMGGGAFEESAGMGMIDSKGSTGGRLRALAANNATKARMSKRNTQRIQAMQQGSGARLLDSYDGDGTTHMNGTNTLSGGGGETSGTASSLAFTPVQGIELVDPSRQRKVDEANAKWFREGTFSLVPGTASASRSSLPTAMRAEPPTTTNKKPRLGPS